MNLCTVIFLIFGLTKSLANEMEIQKEASISKWANPPEIESFKSYEEMHKFFENKSKIDTIENPDDDSYLAAFNLHHEEQLSIKDSIESTKKVLKLSKRSTPEFIKFELSDAKEPDEETRTFFRRIQKNLQNSTNIIEKTLMSENSTKANGTLNTTDNPKNFVTIARRSRKVLKTDESSQKSKKSTNDGGQENEKIKKNNHDSNHQSPRKREQTELSSNHHHHLFHPQDFQLNYGRNGRKYGGHRFDQHRLRSKHPRYPGNHKITYNPKVPNYSIEPGYVTGYVRSPTLAPQLKSVPFIHIPGPISELNQVHTIIQPERVQTVKVIPEIDYVIKEIPAPALKVSVPVSHQHLSGPITSQNEIGYQGYGYAVIKSLPEEEHHHHQEQEQQKQRHKQQQQQQISYASHEDLGQDIIKEHLLHDGNEQLVAKEIKVGQYHQKPLHYLNDEAEYSALTSLVGKPPTDQLQGLTYILNKDVQQPNRPQDSTAPILFHPSSEGSSTQTDPRSSINKPDYVYHGQQVKPITEVPEEDQQKIIGKVSDSVVYITPQPAIEGLSYKKIQLNGLSPNYASLGYDDSKLRYASRYAFGYRVRDFHTGNDFGHKQNRDKDGITRGQYHILLPDGRIQNVIYRADKSGFHADVSFSGGAH